MGCDIHAIREVRREPNGPWLVAKEYDLDRWYAMFRRLVADHGRGDPDDAGPYPARGLPADMSAHAMYLGDHTFSWLTAEELVPLLRSPVHDPPEGGKLYGQWRDLLWNMEEKPEDVVAQRLVFGFDS